MSERDALRIQAFEPHHLDAVVTLALRAWAPVFVSLEASLPKAAFQAFYPKGWKAGQQAAVEAVCRDEETKVWIARAADRIIGFCATKVHAAGSLGEIYMIAVDPDHQRQGVARVLIDQALEQMRQAELSVAMVETGGDPGHGPARATYAAAGFTLWPVARYFREL